MIPFVKPEDRMIEDVKQNILFVLLFDKDKNFLDYCFTELNNKDLILKHMPFHLINNYGRIYAASSVSHLSMHEIVYGSKAPKGYKIDHENSNGLDNRRENLRMITDGGNCHNRIKSSGTTCEYYGVILTNYGKWRSYISFEGVKHHLGEYDNVEDAVKIRDIYAVYFYRDNAKLNTKDGNFFITEKEVQDIYENGIPEKYIRTKRGENRDLPKCIGKQNNLWFYVKKINYVIYRKTFKTKEAAIAGLAKLMSELDEKENRRKKEIENNIVRNSEGIAILYTYDNERNITGEWLVDDEIWKKFIHYNWSISGNYARAYINNEPKFLHQHVYIYFYGSIPDDKTIDHIESKRPDDNRISNLRPADNSLQCHNTIRKKDSCIRHKGISFSSGKFSLKFNGKYIGAYYYEEDAIAEYNNKLATERYGVDATLIDVTDTRTTVADYFTNMSIEFMQNLNTVQEIQEIYSLNSSWAKSRSVKSDTINSKNFREYKELAIKLRTEELEKGITNQKIAKDFSLEYIKSIKTVKDLKGLFREKEHWRKDNDVFFKHITIINFEKYKNLAIKLKTEEMTKVSTPNTNFNPVIPKNIEIKKPVKYATNEDIKNIIVPIVEPIIITPMKVLKKDSIIGEQFKPKLILKIIPKQK